MSIVQNPHVKDPKEMWDTVNKMDKEANDIPDKPDEFDAVGFELFKQKIGQNPRFTIKS